MTTLTPVKDCLYIKWLHAGLYYDAAHLESHSSENFLTERDIRDLMTKSLSHSIGGFVVSEYNKSIAYVIYEKSYSEIEIINLVVHQDYRRQGIASLLLEKLETRKQWNVMTTSVRESNLGAQMFLKKKGFLATRIRRHYFQDHLTTGSKFEDGYHFRKGKTT